MQIQEPKKQFSEKWIQFFRYIVTGTLTTLIDLLVFHTLFVTFLYSENFSVIVAFCIALIFSFIVNKTWTFASSNTQIAHEEWKLSQFIKFIFVSGFGLLLTIATVHACLHIFHFDPI